VSATLGPEAAALLDGPNFGHLATLMGDGAPKVEPVWVMREDDRILVTSDAKSIKSVNVARDARVAVSVTAHDDPYEQLLIRGIVVDVRPDPDLAVLDRFAHKYLGVPFPRRAWSERVVLVIEPSLARYYRSKLGRAGTNRS
jgi:PPOX class probable F420-dependent enzyme